MLIYPGTIEHETTITVDGYSNRKTIKAAIKEMGRYIRDNLNQEEGQSIIDYPEECILPIWAKQERDCFFLEVEEVPGASYYDEDADEVVGYTDANYYICCRFVK